MIKLFGKAKAKTKTKKETMVTAEVSLTFIQDGECDILDKNKLAELIKKELGADDVVVKSTKIFELDK